MLEKGFIKLQILDFESEYFKNKDFTIEFFNVQNQSVRLYSQEFLRNKQFECLFLPKCEDLEMLIFSNEVDEQKEGYFKLPLQKIYALPEKKHLINIKTTWKNKNSNKILQGTSATIKLSIVFSRSFRLTFEISILQISFKKESLDSIVKKDVFLSVTVGQTTFSTSILKVQDSIVKWNEKLRFQLEQLPQKIKIELKQEPIKVKSSKSLSILVINPFIQNFYIVKNQPIKKQFGLISFLDNGQKQQEIGKLQITSVLKLKKQP